MVISLKYVMYWSCEDLANEQMKNRTLKKSFYNRESQFEEETLINQQMQKNQRSLKEDLEKKYIVRKSSGNIIFHLSKFFSWSRKSTNLEVKFKI